MDGYDLIVVGAGPAGQSLVARLAQAPLRIALIDREPQAALATPCYDGREIALTQTSISRLKQLGAWDHLAEAEIAPLTRAEVRNGQSPYVLSFTDQSGKNALGALVPNSDIRRALFQTIAGQDNCDLYAGLAATIDTIDAQGARVRLADGAVLKGRMVVAADTRFSALRKSQGISADMLDFGRTMLVCRVGHAKPHQGVATEWFDHGQTIAMLPLNGDQSSFVLTLSAQAMDALTALSDADFEQQVEQRTQGLWGKITLASRRHTYPLVAVYASRFIAQRFALIGDAAVGMHPITAHGFNFGLRSAYAFGDEVMRALRAGRDIADGRGLARYERAHRRATLPLYAATNAIARLYGDERPLARVARTAGLHLMNITPGARRLVEASLRH